MRPIVFISFLICSWVSNAETLKGIARDSKNQVVYIETHKIEKDENGINKFIRVEYKKPDETVFASMTSDFSKSKVLPDTVFEDKRFGKKTLLRVESENVVFEEFKDDKKISTKSIPLIPKMVASQGFDNFIKLNAKEMETSSVSFKFGVLENKDFFTLTGYKKNSPDLAKNEVQFGIRASNLIFRIFASELSVVYERESFRLKSFRGRSNILDESGRSQNVVINYEWTK